MKGALILSGLLVLALGLALVATRLVAPALIPAPPLRPQLAQSSRGLSPAGTEPAGTEPAGTEALEPDLGEPSMLPSDGAPLDPTEPDARVVEGPDERSRQDVAKSAGSGDVQRLGAGRYRVRRAAVDQALSKGGGLGSTRAVAATQNGSMIGYKLYNVSPKLHALGLRSGDIITQINGRPLTSPDAALAGYGSLRKSQTGRIKVRRGAGSTTLTYIFVD